MEPVHTFCLAALVFLSLPLPVFASAALRVRPAARERLFRPVRANALGLGVAGVLLVTTSLPPLVVLAAGGTVFVTCGARMCARLAEAASGA